jgi:hypothetical protein
MSFPSFERVEKRLSRLLAADTVRLDIKQSAVSRVARQRKRIAGEGYFDLIDGNV